MTAIVHDRPVRIGLAGYGYWGVNLARNIAVAHGGELVAVADEMADRRELASRQHRGVETYDDFATMLRHSELDALVLATPAAHHGRDAVAALRAGKHVMVEKPLATDVKEAEKVVEAAAAADRVAMVGHTFMYAPAVKKLRALVDSGDLGQLQYLYSQRLSLGKIRNDCNALWNFAPHDLSILLYLVQERPVEVSARGFSVLHTDRDDVCFASLSFPSGVGANIHVSWLDPRKTRMLTVVGDRKMAVYDDVSVDQKIAVVDAGVATVPDASLGEYSSFDDFQWRTRAGDILIPHLTMQEPLLLEIEEFVRACSCGSRPVSDAQQGLDVVRVLTALDESARQRGAPVGLAW